MQKFDNSDTSKKSLGPNQDRVLILICAYNEGKNLPELLERIAAAVPNANVLLVDDGSKDSTYQWLDANRARYPKLEVLNRGKKLGLGSAIQSGLLYAIEHQFDRCVNLDADLSHDPAAITQLLDASHQADLVIGSRYVDGGGLENCSWKRIATSRSVNMIARWLIGWQFKDCSSAFRCYRVSSLASIDLKSIDNASYGFLEEVLWRIWKQKGSIVEVPIVYVERVEGVSKISLKEGRETAKTLLRLARWRHHS